MITAFQIWAGLMVAVAAVTVLVLPRWWRRAGDGESTLDWLRLRREELGRDGAGQEGDLLEDAEVRVLEELEDPQAEADAVNAPEPGSGRPLSLMLLAVVAIAPWFIYARMGALEDVRIADRIEALPGATVDEVEALVDAMVAREAERPGNTDYLSLLGQYRMGAGEYEAAWKRYEQLLEFYPESPEVLARAAQAEYLARDRSLSETVRRRAEAALAADPNQRSALGTLGIAAFEAGDYGGAIRYWQRLLAFEQPGSPGYRMLADLIAQAREKGGDASPEVLSGIGVGVAVAVAPGVAIPADATVFVLARPAGAAGGMPIAVQRRQGADLPFNLRLDDRSSMAGQAISSQAAVDIEVQVGTSGQPGREHAQWLASAPGVIPSTDAAIELVLRPVAP